MNPHDALPTGWTWTRFGDICLLSQNGCGARRGKGTPTVVLRLADISSTTGRVATEGLRHIPLSDADREKYALRLGDLLAFRVNGSPQITGKVVSYQGPPDYTFCDHFIRFRLTDGTLNPRLASLLFQVPPGRPQVATRMVSTAGQNTVSQKSFSEVWLPIPPVPEQHRIIENVDSYFTRLDDAVATLERVQRNLKRYRASVLKAAVEGRLVPTEAELTRTEGRDYEPASVLLERILAERRSRWEEAELAKMKAKGKPPKNDKWKAKYKEPAAPDTTDLPELPEGWCWASGEQLSETITKGSSPKWQGFDYVAEGIPFVRSQNVRWGHLDLEELAHLSAAFNKKESKSVLRTGDVLVNIVGASIGRAAVAAQAIDGGNTNQAVAILRPIQPGVTPQYLCLYVISSAGQARIHSAKVDVARANVSLADLRGLPVPLAPLAEQLRIWDEVQMHTSLIDSTGSQVQQDIQRCVRVRQSVLKWAFEGKLVDQDPSDEPAELLLQRIREHREPKPTRRRR